MCLGGKLLYNFKMISVNNYQYKSWAKTFPEKVDIDSIPICTSWKDYIGQLSEHNFFNEIEKTQ